MAPSPIRMRGPERSVEAGLPHYRGRSHQGALALSIPAGAALVATVHGPAARIGALVYALTLAGLFFTSSLYNRRLGTPYLRPWMKWLDHAAIYLLIAGSYTPMCLAVMPRPLGPVLLAVVWGAALAGAALKLVWKYRFRIAGAVLYVAMGWVSVVALPSLFRHLSGPALALLILGGLAYTAGAIVLASRRPDPSPTHFGYHEVWHAFVVTGGACHFLSIWIALH